MDNQMHNIQAPARQNAVSVAIRDGRHFLLIQRMNEPSKGFWALPGGKVEAGETFIDAAKREVREETGLIVDALDLVSILEIGSHYLLHVFKAAQFEGTAIAMDDAADCGWYCLEDMPALPTTQSTMDMITKLLES